MRTTPEPKLEDRETVLTRRAASSQNRRRLPTLLRQKKFRNSIGHDVTRSNTRIVRRQLK